MTTPAEISSDGFNLGRESKVKMCSSELDALDAWLSCATKERLFSMTGAEAR